jgi:hypothetical protein
LQFRERALLDCTDRIAALIFPATAAGNRAAALDICG